MCHSPALREILQRMFKILHHEFENILSTLLSVANELIHHENTGLATSLISEANDDKRLKLKLH